MKISVITPTHNPKWLNETWASLRDQNADFEWIISVNCSSGEAHNLEVIAKKVHEIVGVDERVKIYLDTQKEQGIGARKKFAFGMGQGDILVELDHDDLFTPDALSQIEKTFLNHPEVGFVYSDTIDFDGTSRDQGQLTYRHPGIRNGWIKSGFQFYQQHVEGIRPGNYECVRWLPPTAKNISHIHTAPNHVRAWRRRIYEEIGGHHPGYQLGDDHELICRTFLATSMYHIPEPLYLYRISGENTWSQNVDEIKKISDITQLDYLERIVLRECSKLGLPAYDLGAAISPRKGWTAVDKRPSENTRVVTDLNQRWPWEDSSVGAFRASDLLEHLPDKQHTMKEIHRCLKPDGWLLSFTPSTDGRGAFQDPTHVSYWNQNAFWYWTRKQQAQFIQNENTMFEEINLFTSFPSEWHRENLISYVTANLVAIK